MENKTRNTELLLQQLLDRQGIQDTISRYSREQDAPCEKGEDLSVSTDFAKHTK